MNCHNSSPPDATQDSISFQRKMETKDILCYAVAFLRVDWLHCLAVRGHWLLPTPVSASANNPSFLMEMIRHDNNEFEGRDPN
jgi:hypothetical protein